MRIETKANFFPYLRSTSQTKADLCSPIPATPQVGGSNQLLDCPEPVYWIDSVDALGQPCQVGVAREDILNQYMAWKEEQPPLEVPNKNGWSSANMKFLEERYGKSEELPVFRRFELLDVLQEMNILDGQGLQEKIFPSKIISTEPSGWQCTGYELQDGSWLALGEDGSEKIYPNMEMWQNEMFNDQFWGESPIKSFTTLDAVLQWVEKNKYGL